MEAEEYDGCLLYTSLKESGCEVSKRGKSYRLKLPGWEKAARMDSLGEGYGLEDLQAVLSGKLSLIHIWFVPDRLPPGV